MADLSAIKLPNGSTYELKDSTARSSISQILSQIYPVGSVYLTFADTDPGTIFGGSWTKLGGRFLLGDNDTYPVSEITYDENWHAWRMTNTGGEATHTLTVDEMPSHKHTVPRGGNSFGTKTHGYTSTGTLFTSADDRMSAVGGDQPHNNMPPYITVHMWYRYA